MIKNTNYESFGRYPKPENQKIERVYWRNLLTDLTSIKSPILPRGLGRSYGDSCLNSNGILIDTTGLDKIIAFNNKTGLIRCEAGISFAEILEFLVTRGYFLPTTPGTKYVTLAGAIANDVHGKSHISDGTFGCSVTQFELMRSNGEVLICSPTQNSELFRATIGGLGLTGLITWAEFKAMPIVSSYIEQDAIKINNLAEFFEVNNQSAKNDQFTVAWIDCGVTGSKVGRGIYYSGNWSKNTNLKLTTAGTKDKPSFPFDLPFINKLSVKAFNFLYYNKQLTKKSSSLVHYEPFFYPLDGVLNWNKSYGKNGFIQYQFVTPFETSDCAIKEILQLIAKSGLSSFLTVLKTFGDIKSPGMMSFPMPGVTLAVDFRMTANTLKLVANLDTIVRNAKGRIYPAKDARMNGRDLEANYHEFNEFIKHIDPKFSSDFWRRMMRNINE